MSEEKEDNTAKTFTWVGVAWLALSVYGYLINFDKFTPVDRIIFHSGAALMMGVFSLSSAQLYKLKARIRELEKKCK